jgi:biopolymer transport protein ExbD
MRLPQEPDIPPQINIVPMIDVIFAILTFFIMSSLFLTRPQGLPISLPKADTATGQAGSRIKVTINSKGDLTVNQQPIQLSNLPTQIRTLAGARPQTLVVLSADERVSHGRVVAVMDQLRQIPGVKLAIDTRS